MLAHFYANPPCFSPYAYTTGLIDTLKTYQCISPLMVYAFCSAVSRRAPLVRLHRYFSSLRLNSFTLLVISMAAAARGN